jgi:hypothetical protein
MGRRRNQYAEGCCICGVWVQSGEGWLYADTRPGSVQPGLGSLWSRAKKKVKCDACHSSRRTSKADLLPKAKGPRVWSVREVARWPLESQVGEGWTHPTTGVVYPATVDVWVVVGDERRQVAGADGFMGEKQGGPLTYFSSGLLAGREFSEKAWDLLCERVTAEINRALSQEPARAAE